MMIKKIRNRVSKDVADIILSALALGILSPFFLIIIFLMKLEGLMNPEYRGPVFFSEIRVSKGKEFRIFKFRTVKRNILKKLEKADHSITEFTAYMNKKKYLTPVGAFLAQRYLDELPQLFNVVKGEMSLVGPRPHIPKHYANDLKNGILSARYIKAGLMGIVQSSKGNMALRTAFARMATKYTTSNKLIILIDRLYYQKYLQLSPFRLFLYDLSIMFKCLVVVCEAKGF